LDHFTSDLRLQQQQQANMNWEDIGKQARARLDESIPSEWRVPKDKLPPSDQASVLDTLADSGLFSEDELSITTSSATHIVQNIASGEWTAVDVTRAFCKRAAVAHQLVRSSSALGCKLPQFANPSQTNCLTVTMFDDAVQRAKQLDDHFKQTGKTVGPLHGLPISLKDNFNIAVKTSATGFCAWAEEPMQQDSTIVQVLRDLGAVAYVKTNVPTAMMIAESVNNCYGR
jgi:amidase